jgi:predicted nucleotidyltransferase
MSSVVYKLSKKNLIHPPKWLPDNVQYETMMGSIAYGVSGDTSDVDIYGVVIPPKDDVFPHLRGEIPGFGRQKQCFEQYQEHHIIDETAWAGRGKEYDLTVYSIVKYFNLVMENNPNMIDSLYTPHDCVLHITKTGQLIRDNRDLFLHKGSWHKFRGYAYSQLSKMSGKTEESKRYTMIQQFGYDVKFAYHVVRLILEVEQILTEQTLDLRRNSDMLKAIRAGEWTEQRVRDWFTEKEKSLDEVYHKSTLRYSPTEQDIKSLLLHCLEEHYGSLSNVLITDRTASIVSEIEIVIQKYR